MGTRIYIGLKGEIFKFCNGRIKGSECRFWVLNGFTSKFYRTNIRCIWFICRENIVACKIYKSTYRSISRYFITHFYIWIVWSSLKKSITCKTISAGCSGIILNNRKCIDSRREEGILSNISICRINDSYCILSILNPIFRNIDSTYSSCKNSCIRQCRNSRSNILNTIFSNS